MTPESGWYLQKARRCLAEARIVLGAELAEAAARDAYLAAFHVAQALIFERTGKVSKTHRGTRAEFARLAKADPALIRHPRPSSRKATS